MTHPLEASVLRIRDTAGKLAGAAFLVAPGLVVTCAHVVTDVAKRAPGQTMTVEAHATGLPLEALVLAEGWSPKEADDVAFLRIADCPADLPPVTLAESGGRMNRIGAAFGFPGLPHWALGKLKEPLSVESARRPLLAFDGSEIVRGMSGGPLLDDAAGQVVGMVCEYRLIGKSQTGYAVTAETLTALWPSSLLVAPRAASLGDTSAIWLAFLLEALRSQAGTIEARQEDSREGLYFQVGDLQSSLAIPNDLAQDLLGKARRSGRIEQREAIYLSELLLNTTRARWEREYLPLSGSLHPARLFPTMRIQDRADPSMSSAGEPLDDLRDALMERKKTRLVILGEPGCGKTTTLERLTLDLARRRLNDPQDAKLPLLVDLFEFNMTPPNPKEFLRGEWRRTGLAYDFDEAVLAGEVCFLLDGLNQMPFDDRANRVSHWNNWAHNLPGDNWAVFTCRSQDYLTPLDLPEVQVQQLDVKHIQRYLELRLGADATGLKKAQEDFEACLNSGDHRFKDLARNIFMLSLLVERALESKALTANRADLMADLVERRLNKELGGGRQPDDLIKDPSATLEALVEALSRMGYAMQSDRGATVLNEPDALAALGLAEQTLLEPAMALKLGVDSGLLEKKAGENNTPSISFYHHLLQEFFAGRELLRRFRAGKNLTRHWKVDWKEPHPLLAWLRREPQARRVPPPPVTGWEETTRMAAAQAGPRLEELAQAVARWNLPLAGRCLAEADALESPLSGEFRAQLLARQRSAYAHLPARIDAGLALGELGHPELKAEPFAFEGRTVYAVRPPMQPVSAGVFLLGSDAADQDAFPFEVTTQRDVDLPAFSMARYPVTNAEYRWFIEAGGYDREEWWDAAGWEWRQGGPEAHAGAVETWLRTRKIMQQAGNLAKVANELRWDNNMVEYWKELAALDEEGARQQAIQAFLRPFDRPAFWDDPSLNAPALPVVGVNWHEACAYARWLSAVTGADYALPPETYWEKAARGTDGRAYPWEGAFGSTRCNTVESNIRRATPVGLFPDGASFFGLLDAAGNVWEWSASFFQAYPGGDPQANPDFGEKNRVVRGGSWLYSHSYARCAFRFRSVPDNFNLDVGFRLFSPGLFLDAAC